MLAGSCLFAIDHICQDIVHLPAEQKVWAEQGRLQAALPEELRCPERLRLACFFSAM